MQQVTLYIRLWLPVEAYVRHGDFKLLFFINLANFGHLKKKILCACFLAPLLPTLPFFFFDFLQDGKRLPPKKPICLRVD
jgi:hypothetical protein